MIQLLKKLDSFLDRKWRETSAVLLNLAGNKVEDDIDWLNMHNNMVEEKKKDE